MTDIAFPSGLAPTSMDWRLERNNTIITNPLSKTIQTIGRGGDRWRCTLTMPSLNDVDGNILVAWLDQISRADNWALIPVFQNLTGNTEAGTSFVDLNGSWRSQATSAGLLPLWGGTNLLTAPYVSGGYAVVYNATAAPGYMTRAFSAVAKAYYLVTVDIPPQLGNVRILISDGSTVLYGPVATAVYGRVSILVAPNTNQLQVALYAGSDTDTFSQAFYGDLSVARVYTAEAAFIAGGNSVTVQGSTSSALNSFRVGQFVGIQTSKGFELKRLSRDVTQIGATTLNGLSVNHVGRTLFEPALRGSVAALAPINHINPVCRMKLATQSSISNITAPNFTGTTFELVEDVS